MRLLQPNYIPPPSNVRDGSRLREVQQDGVRAHGRIP
jgi:hypothetical protein